MAKFQRTPKGAARKDSKLKLPDDFLGTVKALLNTPPPPRKSTAKAKRKAAKSRPWEGR